MLGLINLICASFIVQTTGVNQHIRIGANSSTRALVMNPMKVSDIANLAIVVMR
ncbi:MAG: hypothetical protein ACTSQA_06590 [Candidatus Heimdallarchaeaceae archaeon]